MERFQKPLPKTTNPLNLGLMMNINKLSVIESVLYVTLRHHPTSTNLDTLRIR